MRSNIANVKMVEGVKKEDMMLRAENLHANLLSY